MPDAKLPHFVVPSDLIHSDSIRVRGGSPAYVRPNYSAHGDFLRERIESATAVALSSDDAEATGAIFLQVKTPPGVSIEKERQRLRSAGLDIVSLSMNDPRAGTARIQKRAIETLVGKVNTYALSEDHRGRSYLSMIDDICPVPAGEKVSPEIVGEGNEPLACLLVFYSALTDAEQAAVLFAIRSFVLRTEGVLGETRRLANGVLAVEATMRPTEALAAGERFTTLRQVLPDRVFYVPDSVRISQIPPTMEVRPPSGTTAVAVFDTGIDPACRELAGCVQRVISRLPPGAVGVDPEHGTFVGSRVSYGDRLKECLRAQLLSPRTPLVDVPIFGVDERGRFMGIQEGHLASSIDSALNEIPPNARVLNLSLGTQVPLVDGQISIVASLLDFHARARDLLVVTSAGNIRDEAMLQAFPNAHVSEAARIDPPGDSLLGLTVGSIAHYAEPGFLSRSRELSPFSRRGPGPFGGIKPDLVAHGGNIRADASTSGMAGVHGLMKSPPGGWATDFGTSFAAPLVSAMAAELMDHYSNAPANLVKALLLHFTKPVIAPAIGLVEQHLIGRGEPDLEAAMWASPHAATFLFAGELQSTRFTYVPFQVPPCLAPGGNGRLRIRATVVMDTPVAPDNPLEYCLGRLTLGLRKPAEIGHARVSGVDFGVDPGKWSPVEHLEKTFVRSYSPGIWELAIRLWTRNLPEAHRQSFATVIQVLDENGSAPVLSEIEDMPERAFNHAQVSEAA